MVHYIMPFLNFAMNGFVLYKLSAFFPDYLEFEYIILCLFFLFFCMIGLHGLFKNIFSFLENKTTFNLLFVVQFFTAVLVMQLLGVLFTFYLAFILMLVYLMWTKQHVVYNFFLHLCGIVISGLFAVIYLHLF